MQALGNSVNPALETSVTLQNALTLSKALSCAPEYLKCVGWCPWEEKLVKEGLGDLTGFYDDDNEEQSDSLKTDDKVLAVWVEGHVQRAWQSLNGRSWQFSRVSFNMTLMSNTCTQEMDAELFEKLYKHGTEACFGDMTTHTTRVDATVKRGKELMHGDKWEVAPEVCALLEAKWAKKGMLPSNVEVKPYKMNLYQQGDGFVEHSDTPSDRLVGTILIGLLEDDVHGGFSVRHGQESARWSAHSSHGKNMIMFYADCPHVVDVVMGRRATLSFKVFSKEPKPPNEPSNKAVDASTVRITCKPLQHDFQKAITKLLGVCPKGFGLVLSHGYNLHAEQLKGKDRVAFTLLGSMPGVEVKTFPVMVCLDSERYEDCNADDNQASCMVYPMRDEDLLYVVHKMQKLEAQKPSRIIDGSMKPFFFLERSGMKVRHSCTPYIEYTGNEAAPESIESVYMQRAFFVRFARDENQSAEDQTDDDTTDDQTEDDQTEDDQTEDNQTEDEDQTEDDQTEDDQTDDDHTEDDQAKDDQTDDDHRQNETTEKQTESQAE